MRDRSFWLHVFCLLACGILSSAWCITSARQLSATFDEPLYVTEGLQRWRTGSTAVLMKYGTMPLPVDVQTLPLYIYEKARGTPIDTVAEFHHILPIARAGNLVFWWLLLFHVWLLARSLGGRWAGTIAVALLAFEPSVMSHAALATTDIAVAACLVALAYHYRANRDKGWWRRVAWPAFWFGMAVLAKASGLVFGCLILLLIEADYRCWWRRILPFPPASGGEGMGVRGVGVSWRFRDSFRELIKIGLLGMVLVFVWCGTDWKPQKSWVAWAHKLPEGPFASVMVWLSEYLRIFSNAGEGIMRQVTHNMRGHGSYLLGEAHPKALWYYFPVALSIKLTIPLLIMPLVLFRRRRPDEPWYGNWAILCAIVLLVFSLTCRVQIGIRFMFPLIALAVAGLSALLVRRLEGVSVAWTRRAALALLVGCLAWTASSAAAVWPHGMCYVNPLWGGMENGYRLVSEANYDWGQGVKELAAWQAAHSAEDLDVWYFGTDPLAQTSPLHLNALHTLPIRSPNDVEPHVRGRFIAVSTTLLHGSILTEPIPKITAFLRTHKPVARTTTFLIYDFTGQRGS